MNRVTFATIVLFLLAGLAMTGASAAGTVSLGPSSASIGENEVMELELVIDAVPEGLSGYDFTVAIQDPAFAEITGLTYPAWASLSIAPEGLPDDSVQVKAVDASGTGDGAVVPGATDVLLGTVTVHSLSAGSTAILITPNKIDDETGSPIVTTTLPASLEVRPPSLAFVPESITISQNETTGIDFVLDRVPFGLSGYSVTISLSDPSVGEITAASYPAGVIYSESTALPDSSVGMQMIVDFDAIEPGSENVFLGTVTVRGKGAGSSTLGITVTRMDDPDGNPLNPVPGDAELTVTAGNDLADFTASPRSGYAPLTVQFTSISGGTPVGWEWNFGDGKTATEENPRHTYSSPGSYTVSLTIENASGETGSRVLSGYIVVTAVEGGGGGGSSGSYRSPSASTTTPVPTSEPRNEFTTTGSLDLNADGSVGTLTEIWDTGKNVYLQIDAGVIPLNASGGLLEEVTVNAITDDEVPPENHGSTFAFAGYAYECLPANATFDPAIPITFVFSEEEWNAIGADEFVIGWYDDEAGAWEALPTVVDPITRTVGAETTHFSIFALFATADNTPAVQPAAAGTTGKPATGVQTPSPTDTIVPAASAQVGGGFPWFWIIGALMAILLVVGAHLLLEWEKKFDARHASDDEETR
jgi:PKD repeat protein